VKRALLLPILLAGTAAAAPRIDPMFSDHAVVQRSAPIDVRGTANPGERLAVSFADRTRSTRADKNGHWTARFGPLEAGGPYRLQVRGADGSAQSDDLMIGDVWLCSGQSNMEFPLKAALNGEGEVAGASDPQLRLMKVPHNDQLVPQHSFDPRVSWKVATPDSARDFSAACYFMVRSLKQSHGIAIGAIDSSWGGTAIHSWMDDESVRATGGGADVDLIKEYHTSPEATVRGFAARWSNWWRERSGDAPGREPWHASDRLAWRAISRMTLWEQWGDPAFADYNGAMWARVRFTLTPQQAAQGATLHLGAIDDFDRSFVNGEPVGQTFRYDKPRDYPLAPGVLKAGANEVVVYILDTGGGGGFSGPADVLKLSFANGTEKAIGQGWEYSAVPAEIGTPPLPPWDQYPGVTTLYNGMIAPLGPIHLKGVAWYQGEADVGKAGYDKRLNRLIDLWTAQFTEGQPQILPFLVVGLAGYGHPPTQPGPSSWAALIDEQRRGVADANGGTISGGSVVLVSAIDIGERDDIHPPNKQELGRRLALAAEKVAYENPKGRIGPWPVGAYRLKDGFLVTFVGPVKTYGGATALGFELCADTQQSCRYANAVADSGSEMGLVHIAADGKPATRVRYAWADYPIINLYGADRLPVPPFEISIDR
jgi:sialate O-acetylesterase